jgi:hypothetical protein
MDTRTLVEHIVSVGERYSTKLDDMRNLVLKLVVLSMRYVDRRALWRSVFEDEYVDWVLLEQLPLTQNVLGDGSCWMSLLNLCSWTELANKQGEIAAEHKPLSKIRKSLREVDLDMGSDDGWTLPCKALILSLVQGLTSLYALEVLTCQTFKRNTHSACMTLLSKQADVLFTPDEYMRTMTFILDNVVVNTPIMTQNLILLKNSREERKLSLTMRNMTVVQGRPRLRDKVTDSLKTDENKTLVDISMSTWESYNGFNRVNTLPSTLSETVKGRLYFLASQSTWNWREQLPKVLASAGPLLAKVASHPVSHPDLPVIVKVIESVSMDGSNPFQELTDFRVKCFQSFPVTSVQRMTLTQFLRLYITVYLPRHIWKDVWKQLVGVISVQIIRDCEQFSYSVPFATNHVMRLICAVA